MEDEALRRKESGAVMLSRPESRCTLDSKQLNEGRLNSGKDGIHFVRAIHRRNRRCRTGSPSGRVRDL